MTKTLNITDEAYDLLKSLKAEGESFTDVIKRLAGERKLSEIAGALTGAQADAVEAAIASSRAASAKRRSRQIGEMS